MTYELVQTYLRRADALAASAEEWAATAAKSEDMNPPYRDRAGAHVAAEIAGAQAALAAYWLERAKDERPR